jgi:protein-tyrosine kinase
MSRIHDALKKAEQERTPGQTIEVPATAPVEAPAAVASPEWRGGPAVASMEPAVSALPITPASYLRFDDLKARCAHPDWQPDPNMNVFFNPALSVHGAEQFRTLRSRLYQLRGSQAIKTVLVTSSLPGEGKTFVATNLAQAIVRQPDRRALVIDADLRCARVHTLLGAPSSPGLSDYLRGDVDELAIVQYNPQADLSFIPGGSDVTNPSELLSNGSLRKLLDRVAPVFDWVILDSPPCLPVADAAILAELCDAVLLVVRAGSTPSSIAARARQELQGHNLVGVVLNAVEEAGMYGSYYYRTYGYPSQSEVEAADRKA